MSITHRTVQWTVPAYAAAFAALEGYDQLTYGVTVPSLLADQGLDAETSTAGVVGSVVGLGMIVGAALSAVLMRRFGARQIMFGGSVLFSVAMLICAAAQEFWLFGAARGLVGIGLGLVTPSVTAYVADLSSPDRRSLNIGIMLSGYAVGGLAAPLLGAALLPDESWRWIYLIGALPAFVLIPVAIRVLPQSPVTRADPRGGGNRDLFGLRPLLSTGARVGTLLLWTIASLGLLLGFGLSAWLPTIMQAAGYSVGSALLQTAVVWVGAGVGMIFGGWLADRVGIKRVLVIGFLVGALGLVLLSLRPPTGVLVLLLFVSGFGILGSQALVYALIVTRYPAELRGWGISWALSVGRIGAIAGPLLGAAVLSSQLPVQWNFYAFAIPGALAAVLVAVVPLIRVRTTPGVDADHDPEVSTQRAESFR